MLITVQQPGLETIFGVINNTIQTLLVNPFHTWPYNYYESAQISG